MKAENNDIDFLNSLLGEYKITQEIPIDVNELCIDRKDELYKKILKTLGIFTALSGIFLTITFTLKKLLPGFFTASKVLIVSTTITAVSTGTYVTVKKIIPAKEPVTIEKEISEEIVPSEIKTQDIIEREKPVNTKPATLPAKKYTVGIVPFTSMSLDKKTLHELNKLLTNNMVSARGKKFSGIIKESNNKNVNYTMFNSIDKIDDEYSLVIKLVNIKTSQIDYLKRKKVKSLIEVKEECVKASKDIADRVK